MKTLTTTRFHISTMILVSMLILIMAACGTTDAGREPAGNGGQVEGLVTQDGRPAASIEVSLLEASKAGETPTPKPEGMSTSQETKTDLDGKFAFKDVLPGNYILNVVVIITNENLRCVVTEGVEVKANDQVVVNFEIPKEITLFGPMGTLPDGKVALCVKGE